MTLEKGSWIAVFLLLLLIIFLAVLGIYIGTVVSAAPEVASFLLGFIVFFLLANKLLFGYSGLILTLQAIRSEKEIDKEKLKEKSKTPHAITEELEYKDLIFLWLKDIDYYRYTYYGIFSLLLLIWLLMKLDLFGILIGAGYLEGAFWGAAVVSFLVWTLDLTAHYLFSEILEGR